jgi:hypothetical protein
MDGPADVLAEEEDEEEPSESADDAGRILRAAARGFPR